MQGMNNDILEKDAILLSIVAAGEMEIDSEGRIWRMKKRHGRGPLIGGGGYQMGTRSSPCQRVRAEYLSPSGYLLVTTMTQGVRTVTGAHRVVWTYFNGPIPEGKTINHKNGVKDDNKPDNLEPATYSEQRQHALEVLHVNRNHPKGSLHPKTHLTEADVLEIRRLRATGVMVKDLAVRYGITKKGMSAICCRRTWLHI